MGILERILCSSRQPDIRRRAIAQCAGAITARRAWTVVTPFAERHDRNAKLTFVTSGTDMSPEGRSRTWEFIFLLPTHNATLLISLEPDPQSKDIDTATCVLTQRLNPALSRDALKPALPQTFRDSPEVVKEFIARGVDYVAGPSDMKLEGRILPSGDAAWITYFWDKEFTTPFTERAGSQAS